VQRAAVAAVAAVAIPVLAGCDTSPGAAALVGSDRISVGTLQHEVDAALADPTIAAALQPGSQFAQSLGGSRAGFVRLTLSRLITDRLLAAVAAAHHVTVTSKDVSDQTQTFVQEAGSLAALRQEAAQSVGVTASQLPDLIRLTVLQQRLSAALVANLPATPAQLRAEYRKDIGQYDQLDVSQIAVSSKSLADRVLAAARRSPSSFPGLARRYSQDTTTQANGGHVGLVPRSQVVSLLGSAAKAKPGSIALVHTSGQYDVVHVIARHVVPLAQAAPRLKEALFANQAANLLHAALLAESHTLGVRVSPRYGTWDATTASVVAAKSPVSSSG
jgi:parvulin-like peptidyl-prolyl isomerase